MFWKTHFYHVSHIFLGSKQILLQIIEAYKQHKKQKSKQKKLKSQDQSWRDQFVGSSVRMRDGLISSWVRDAISPSRGGDEDGDLTGAISNSTARSLSLCLRVCEFFLSLFLSLRVSGNDLKVKQKLKIFSGLNGLFYGQSK